MKKTLLVALALASSVIALPAGAQVVVPSEPGYRAVEVTMIGGFVGFDQGAYQAMRSIMGAMIASGNIDQFITHTQGLEGGGGFCAELGRKATITLDQIRASLLTIKADPASGTIYEVKAVEDCSVHMRGRDGGSTN